MPNLNPQQEAIKEFIVTQDGSLNVVARAGTGKTYTLINGVIVAIVDNNLGDSAIMAFNKSASNEFETRLAALAKSTGNQDYLNKQVVASGTVHSFGLNAWKWASGNKYMKVDGFKVRNIIDNYSEAIMRDFKPIIAQAVSLAKQWAFGLTVSIDDHNEWKQLIDHFGLETNGNADAIIDAAIRIYKQSLSMDRDVVDFDDMILAPLLHKCSMFQKDFVLLDEAQDTNPSRRALAMKMLKPVTGRLIAVGDDKQAIYGFTGANSDSLELIRAELNSEVLPLNITYRCPKAVVTEAQRLVPDFVADDSAPLGEVRSIPSIVEVVSKGDAAEDVIRYDPWFLVENPTNEDAILCRNTKPLIEQAHKLLAAGIGCRVEGRDIGQGLINLANRWKSAHTLDQLITRVEHYNSDETQKWMSKGQESKAQSVDDKCETLILICQQLINQGKNTLKDLNDFINSLFGDTPENGKPNVLTLSTIHKSKGREWRRVYLYSRSTTLPSKWARKDWQREQEANLEYVAITRAKEQLIYVD